jgi:hypothetical protein
MLSSLRLIVVGAALVTGLPAQAQFLGFGLETNVELTKQDLDIPETDYPSWQRSAMRSTIWSKDWEPPHTHNSRSTCARLEQ